MINLFILILLIIIVILVIQNREFFTSDIVRFLSTKNTCKELKKIKEDYKYNKLDLKLRSIDSTYHKNIYQFYCDNLIDFTKHEKKLLLWCVDSMKDTIKLANLKIDLMFIFKGIKFAKFEDFVDNGYPHTNSDIIFLTGTFINRLYKYYNNNDIKNMFIDVGSIIIHECIHIWQRKEPEKFMRLYKKYWHFSNPNKIYNLKFLEKIRRFNPDGKKINWVLNLNKKHILLASIYKENATNIGNVHYVGVFLDKQNGHYSINEDEQSIKNLKNITDIEEFNDFFRHLYGNHYHPNELSAELLSIFYLKTLKLSHRKFTNTAYKNMLLWLKEFL